MICPAADWVGCVIGILANSSASSGSGKLAKIPLLISVGGVVVSEALCASSISSLLSIAEIKGGGKSVVAVMEAPDGESLLDVCISVGSLREEDTPVGGILVGSWYTGSADSGWTVVNIWLVNGLMWTWYWNESIWLCLYWCRVFCRMSGWGRGLL